MAQLWVFEEPNTVTATFPVNLTWSPRTFNAVRYGNFTLNLWLLRADSTENNVLVGTRAPSLLAREQRVFSNSVLWTPALEDVDIGVPVAGSHQVAWEQSARNPGLSPSKTSLEGFSQRFNIRGPVSITTSSSSSSSSSSFVTSSSASAAAASSSSSASSTTSPNTSSASSQTSMASSTATSLPIVLGLSIGLGILALLFLIGAIWGVRKFRQIQTRRLSVPPEYGVVQAPAYHSMHTAEVNGGYVQSEAKPVELPGGPDARFGFRE